MAGPKATGDLYNKIIEQPNAKEPLLNVDSSAYATDAQKNATRPSRSWFSWLWEVWRVTNQNFDSVGASEFSSLLLGRIEDLEARLESLRLQGIASEADRAQEPEPVVIYDVPQPVEPAAAQVVATQDFVATTVSDAVDALSASMGARLQAVEGVADQLSLQPAGETGQLFRTRSLAQFIDPAQMYLPTTQPAAGPNMYETVVNGSAFRCFEFAPGTLAADNDHVLFVAIPPDRWDGGTIAWRAIWSHAATVTNFLVAWKCQAGAYYDNTSGVAALSLETTTGAVMGDTGGTTDNIYISTASATQSFVTPANVTPTVAGQPYSPILFRFGRRNQSEGVTGLAVNARLLGVDLIWGLKAEAAS